MIPLPFISPSSNPTPPGLSSSGNREDGVIPSKGLQEFEIFELQLLQ